MGYPYKSKDSKKDYINFNVDNFLVTSRKLPLFLHRLGGFNCVGIGMRPNNMFPNVIVLHTPAFEDPYRLKTGPDHTAENIAKYLADPPENKDRSNKIASVHACSDRDSYVLTLPADSQCYGCANPNTRIGSWEIEIAGTGKETAEYWKSDDAILKYRFAVKAMIQSFKLAYTDQWRKAIPPFQKASMMDNGTITTPGFTQHREVPYAVYSEGKFVKWATYPENLKYGQHSDIHAEFPFELFFKIVQEEISKEVD